MSIPPDTEAPAVGVFDVMEIRGVRWVRMTDGSSSISADGRPVAFARMTVTNGRGGELAEIFADDEIYQIPRPNPMTADAAGAFSNFAARVGDYRVVITDPEGVQVVYMDLRKEAFDPPVLLEARCAAGEA